jgi:hypothetical protein
MIFLIEYDRDEGRIVTIKPFESRKEAEQSRLELELSLNAKDIEHEVVLLEATNEEAVRRTHRRYFEDLADFTPHPPTPLPSIALS